MVCESCASVLLLANRLILAIEFARSQHRYLEVGFPLAQLSRLHKRSIKFKFENLWAKFVGAIFGGEPAS